MQLVITNEAQNAILNNFDIKTAKKINEKLTYFAENYNELVKTKNVEKLTNSNISKYRITIDIRAFFITYYDKANNKLIILDVVNRENAYRQRQIERYEKLAKTYEQESQIKSKVAKKPHKKR